MKKKRSKPAVPTSLQFFGHLRWLDGKPLLDTIEDYRRWIFTQALDNYRPDGSPQYSMVLAGRGKKNAKSLDLILAALFTLVIRRSVQGSDGFILANDADQARDDLMLAKKLIACNPDLAAEIEPLASELRLRDGSAVLKILPAKDVAGAHGKSAAFIGYDEVHGYRDWGLMEALQPDPTRVDALTWITSYASIYNVVGAPLHDLMAIGKAGTDKRQCALIIAGGDAAAQAAKAATMTIPIVFAAFAVLELMTSSNFVGSMIGRSPGFSPLRIRPA